MSVFSLEIDSGYESTWKAKTSERRLNFRKNCQTLVWIVHCAN